MMWLLSGQSEKMQLSVLFNH